MPATSGLYQIYWIEEELSLIQGFHSISSGVFFNMKKRTCYAGQLISCFLQYLMDRFETDEILARKRFNEGYC